MARRKRGVLTAEDRRLWEEVAATATPLRPGSTTLPPQLSAAQPIPPTPAPVRAAAARRITLDLAPDPHATLGRATPGMDRRRFEKLRRGRYEPEARIDLHGMTSERAHAALARFILDAHAADLRLVLVITGKGRADEAELAPRRHGVLRHSLPHWLSAPPLAGRILQVASAHHRHGGAGAFYVYLRRRR